LTSNFIISQLKKLTTFNHRKLTKR